MKLHLFCIVLCVILIGCGSNQTKENPDKKVEVEAEVKKPETEVKKPEIEVKPAIQVHEIKPEKIEPTEDPNINWDQKEMQEEAWESMRNLYVVQYITNPDTISLGLQTPLSKGASFYLEKGYGIFWNSATKRPKDLELGFLYAREKKQEDMEDSLKKLERLGKGEHYYLLTYVVSWYYCLNSQNKQAKQLMEAEDLANNIALYGIKISQAQMNLLIAKAQEN